MKLKQKTGLSGNIKITVYNLDGSVKEVVNLHNEIKTCWINAIRDMYRGSMVNDLEIKYLAWGSDDTANDPSQTTLISEFGRKQVTAQEDGDDGEVITTTYIAPSEGNDETIEEIGWFAGASATSTPDSGILVARILYSRDKTDLESLEIERTDTIAEVV